jgi:hypothetical protein
MIILIQVLKTCLALVLAFITFYTQVFTTPSCPFAFFLIDHDYSLPQNSPGIVLSDTDVAAPTLFAPLLLPCGTILKNRIGEAAVLGSLGNDNPLHP